MQGQSIAMYFVSLMHLFLTNFLRHGLSTQVFVANPNKPEPIVSILLKNKDKLIDFLGRFHNDRTGVWRAAGGVRVTILLQHMPPLIHHRRRAVQRREGVPHQAN
jgi:hypothetical protein